MFSRKQILSAIVGVAMLALPVSAFAGHHDGDWNRPRPFAWHDQGLHRGWAKHQWTQGGWYGTPAQRAPINVASPAYPPYAWNRHHQWLAPEPPYQAYPPAYGYAPVASTNCNPAAVYSGSTPSQSPSWLTTKRYNTMRTIAQLRARGDSRGAARLVPTVKALNQRIGGLNRQRGCGVAPMSAQANAIPYNNSAYYNGSYANNQTVNALSTIAVPMLSGIR